MARGHALDGAHVGSLPVQMDRQDGARSRADGSIDVLGVQGQPRGIDVGEDGARADHENGQRGVGGRQRGGDDLVARPDAQPAQHECQGIGAGADADRMRRARERGKLRLEGLHFGSEHEPAAGDHAVDRRADIRLILARHQREERDAPHARVDWPASPT